MPGLWRVYVATSVPVMAAITATGPSPRFVSESPIQRTVHAGSRRVVVSADPLRHCFLVSDPGKSKLKSRLSEDAQGNLRPIRRLYGWSFAGGARDTAESVTSWLARWTTKPLNPSAIAEQDGPPAV